MSDSTVTVAELKELVKRFCEARDWDQYHDPKELSIGISTEAAELLDIFRFKTKEQMVADKIWENLAAKARTDIGMLRDYNDMNLKELLAYVHNKYPYFKTE